MFRRNRIREEKHRWYFKVGDIVTWNERTGVFPGSSHLCYEEDLGTIVTVEDISSMPRDVLNKWDGYGPTCPNEHQYVKVRGSLPALKFKDRWWSARWFKPC
jgi:hypothetical protein